MNVQKILVISVLGLVSLAGLSAQAKIPERKLITVREYPQKYPLSCEAAASSVAMQFLGLDIAEDQVLAVMPVDKTTSPLTQQAM